MKKKSKNRDFIKDLRQSMQIDKMHTKMDQKTPEARFRWLKKHQTAGFASPVIKSPRLRRYFGLDNPHTPY